MKIFTVLETTNLKTKEKDNQQIFIEEGFSFYAFFFDFFWFVYHRLWVIAVVILASSSILSLLHKNNLISGYIFIALRICMSLTIGIFAKTWYIEYLKAQNCKFKGVIAAKTEDQAKIRFYEKEKFNV